jgi:endoglucanase
MLAQQQIRPPLHTSGHEILDSAAHVVRLTSVNWYGFDQKEYVPGGLDDAPLDTIIGQIQAIGANSVRLPWANETLEHNPLVADYAVKANPQYRGKHALDVMDAVIAALARAHIMVILDNHVNRADWCCKDGDGTEPGTPRNIPRRSGWWIGRRSLGVTRISPGSWALICATNCAAEHSGAEMIRG